MDINKLLHSLDGGLSPDKKRQELIAYLKTCVDTLPSDEDGRQAIAYNMTSLLSTDYARSLTGTDTVDEVLTLAGELEVPDDNSSAKWTELCKLVHAL